MKRGFSLCCQRASLISYNKVVRIGKRESKRETSEERQTQRHKRCVTSAYRACLALLARFALARAHLKNAKKIMPVLQVTSAKK